MTFEDGLSDIAADLVGFGKYGAFLDRLFCTESGSWSLASLLIDANSDVGRRLAEVETRSEGPVRVTWLDYPASSLSEGYCVIVFFSEQLHWYKVALYNKRSRPSLASGAS